MVVPSCRRRELCNFSGDVWGDQTRPDMLFTVGRSLNNHPILGGTHITHTPGWTDFLVDNWPAEASILTVPVKKPAGSATTCGGCRSLLQKKWPMQYWQDWLSMVPWDLVFDAQSLAQCGHAPSPTPSPRDHSPHRRLWASQSLPGSGIFDFTERYRKLMSTMVSCSSQILMDSFFIICLSLFLLGKTHQFQILPIISFSMFPTCSSYPHYLQFKSNIITLYFPLYPHYLHLSPMKNPVI